MPSLVYTEPVCMGVFRLHVFYFFIFYSQPEIWCACSTRRGPRLARKASIEMLLEAVRLLTLIYLFFPAGLEACLHEDLRGWLLGRPWVILLYTTIYSSRYRYRSFPVAHERMRSNEVKDARAGGGGRVLVVGLFLSENSCL